MQVVQVTIDPYAKIEFRPNTEDDPHKRKPDITKARELLGWHPTVSLRNGLPLMVEDFKQRWRISFMYELLRDIGKISENKN